MANRHSQQLDGLIDHLESLTDEDVALLAGAWQEEDEGTRRRAWATAKGHIRQARLEKLLDRARNDVGRWAAAARADYHGMAGLLGQPTQEANLRMRAAPAILDAAAAILAEDVLDEYERLVLTRPWQSVVAESDDPPR